MRGRLNEKDTVEIVDVTPDMALIMLKERAHPRQRRLNKKNLYLLKADMRAKWKAAMTGRYAIVPQEIDRSCKGMRLATREEIAEIERLKKKPSIMDITRKMCGG
jgi:hypothetical protein